MGVGVHRCCQPRCGDERQRAQPVVGTPAGAQAKQKQLRLQLGRGKHRISRNKSAVLDSHRVHPRRHKVGVAQGDRELLHPVGGPAPRPPRRRRRPGRRPAGTLGGGELRVDCRPNRGRVGHGRGQHKSWRSAIKCSINPSIIGYACSFFHSRPGDDGRRHLDRRNTSVGSTHSVPGRT